MLALNLVSETFDGRPALIDVTLAPAQGSRTAVVGVNGSGKSTLLRIAAGGGWSPTRAVVRDGAVGYVPQDNGLVAGRSVAAYLKERTGISASSSSYGASNVRSRRATPGRPTRTPTRWTATRRWAATSWRVASSAPSTSSGCRRRSSTGPWPSCLAAADAGSGWPGARVVVRRPRAGRADQRPRPAGAGAPLGGSGGSATSPRRS